jgi:hypothetical protein
MSLHSPPGIKSSSHCQIYLYIRVTIVCMSVVRFSVDIQASDTPSFVRFVHYRASTGEIDLTIVHQVRQLRHLNIHNLNHRQAQS